MSLYSTYTLWLHKKIDDAEAAQAYGLTEKDWKFRLSRYGKRLPLVLKTLDRISEDELTREEAAALLQVSPRQINQLQIAWKVTRPLKEYVVNRAVSEVKWEIRKKFAIEFIAGSCKIDEAAENATVSERQMRRWVSELLDKHFGMVYKDLKDLALRRRQRLADEIETAEGLEVAKLNVLAEVAKGEKAIQEVALERVMSKRTVRNSNHVRGST